MSDACSQRHVAANVFMSPPEASSSRFVGVRLSINLSAESVFHVIYLMSEWTIHITWHGWRWEGHQFKGQDSHNTFFWRIHTYRRYAIDFHLVYSKCNVFSSAGWANSTAGRTLSVCVYRYVCVSLTAAAAAAICYVYRTHKCQLSVIVSGLLVINVAFCNAFRTKLTSSSSLAFSSCLSLTSRDLDVRGILYFSDSE